MSDSKYKVIVAVKILTQVEDDEGGTTAFGFSGPASHVEDLKTADFFQLAYRKHCRLSSEEDCSLLPNRDHTYLEVRLPVVIPDDEFISDEMAREENARGVESSSVKQFGILCRAAAAVLAKDAVIACDTDTLGQARSLASSIQSNFKLTHGHTLVVYLGEVREPVTFSISPKSLPKLSDRTPEVFGTVNNYSYKPQVQSCFWIESTGVKITVEVEVEHSALFKEALQTGEILRLTIQPYGDSEKYTRALVISSEKTGRFR